MTTTNITLDTYTEATTKELVAFYNSHNVDKPVSKFADRKTAERRVKAILDELEEAAAQARIDASIDQDVGNVEDLPTAPVHRTRKSRTVVEGFVSPNSNVPEDQITEEQALAELAAMRAHTAATKKTVGAKSGLTLSAAIAKSWADPEVAAKRMTRDGVFVTVNGKTGEFKSVRSAFAELGLPDSKHIRFRMKVKENGSAIFEFNGQSYHFSLGTPAGGFGVNLEVDAENEAE